VRANVIGVAAQVGGAVKEIHVVDNQAVHHPRKAGFSPGGRRGARGPGKGRPGRTRSSQKPAGRGER
jgi:hypothetical protein